MPITRPQLESLLVRANRAKLAYAKLDATTADGTNPDLAGPIAMALRSLALPPADPTNPTTADLLGVADADLAQLVDVADLGVLEMVLGNRAAPDQIADVDNRQDHGKFYDSLEKTVLRKEERCRRSYGLGLPSASLGTLDLDFAPARCPGGPC